MYIYIYIYIYIKTYICNIYVYIFPGSRQFDTTNIN